MKTELRIPSSIYHELLQHLLPKEQANEEAAFVFATVQQSHDRVNFEFKELYKAQPRDFLLRSEYYFELTDEARSMLIKRSHDLDTGIIEFHSHLDQWYIQFSSTDLSGLNDFVPHVLWRLKGKPYVAVVVTHQGFDALVWIDDPKRPTSLDALIVDTKVLTPTNNSLTETNEDYWREI